MASGRMCYGEEIAVGQNVGAGWQMAIGSFQARVSQVRDLTHDVRELELTLCAPKEIIFKAGQFISFDVPKEGYPYPATRPYSIASPPLISDRVLLLFNLVPGGLDRRTSLAFAKVIQ